MGFDDLDEAMSDQDNEEPETDQNSNIDSQQNSADFSEDAKQSLDSIRETTESASSGNSLDHPAFPFEDSKQEAIYPTVETLTKFDDTLDFEVKRRLRDEGLRDVPKREYHEALLQLAIEQPERLAELVIENRR